MWLSYMYVLRLFVLLLALTAVLYLHLVAGKQIALKTHRLCQQNEALVPVHKLCGLSAGSG
jgi:cell division protein FtsB